MDWKQLSSSKIDGAIDTQFKTNIAVERLMKASGQPVKGGITDWLEFLETIQTVSVTLYCLFNIITITIGYIFVGLYRLIKWIWNLNKKETTIENNEPKKQVLSKTDIDNIKNTY